jgi:hypothetical protein
VEQGLVLMLIDDIITELTESAPFTDSGANTYTLRKYYMPDGDGAPDEIILAEETVSGRMDINAMGASKRAPIRQQEAFQLRVRGPRSRYDLTREMAETVHLLLANLNKTISGRKYHIRTLIPPRASERGQDKNSRWQVVATYLVLKERG